jgi:hypothetical protein
MSWTELDSRNIRVEDHRMHRSNVGTYECQNRNSAKTFRFIRMVHTLRKRIGNPTHLSCQVEFYGRIRSYQAQL